MSEAIESTKHVLVPMNVEALAVGRQVVTPQQGWSDLRPDFARLYKGKILGGQLTPSLDTQKKMDLPAGIHLHWALPDALTHGRQVRSQNGDAPSTPPKFPHIPNRWMVQRISRQPDTGKIAVRAWIIESDYLFGAKEDAPAHCVTIPKLDALPLFARAGKCVDYSGWREGADPAYKFKLTALGYGDPAFAAFYPACKSLLGFHDALDDVPDNTTLTYMVAGWYSDATQDPLFHGDQPYAPAEWIARLGELKWSVDPPYPIFRADPQTHRFVISGYGDLSAQFPVGAAFEVLGDTANRGSYSVTGTSYEAPEFSLAVANVPDDQTGGRIAPPQMACPDRTVCHGQVYNIAWRDKNTVYASQVPDLDADNCRVAVGNSSGEALAALFAETLDHPRAEDLLTALQGDILSHNTDNRELEALLHQNRFSSFDGGRILGVRRETGREPDATTGQEAALSDETMHRLDAVNQAQTQRARLRRELTDYRWELYAAWYKQVLAQGAVRLDDQIEALKRKIADLQAALTADDSRLRAGRDDFKAALQAKFKDLTPVTTPAPPFWQANEPVVLVASEATRASKRHGHDGRFADTGELHCRISGQETTAIVVDIPNNRRDVTVPAAQTFDVMRDTFTGGGAVPPGITAALLHECLLLDPSRAGQIADQAYREAGLTTQPGRAALLADIDAWQRPETAATPTTARSIGVPPSPIGRCDWHSNPWLPVFLKWRLVWHSSYGQIPDALAKWSFTGDGEDYRFTGDASDDQNGAFYEGYTILTPHALRKFKEAVETYNRTAKDPALEKIITQLGDLNILSQFLGGLQKAFTMRDTVLQLPPIKLPPDEEIIDPIAAFVSDAADASPDPDKPFLPIRAGHARLLEVAVVDAFGQTMALPDECLARPARAVNLRIDGAKYAPLIELPPRVAQPMRLRFDWPAAANPASVPVNSPICGWVMPNYLDKNLLFFDADGNGLGAVQKILRESAAGGTGGAAQKDLKAFFWVPQPGTELQPTDIFNPELKQFVHFLTAMDADTGDAFWRVLDTAVSKMDSGVPEDDPLLSILVGRPLVLVSASLNLELAGLPAYDQALDKVGRADTGGFDQIQFPLLLGDAGKDTDGLVGYFRMSEPAVADLGPFLPAAGAPGPGVPGTIEPATPLTLTCSRPQPLTLLMDPLARVHARTGVLPKTYGELPHRWRSAAKAVRTAFFQAAPVISPGGDLRLPKPSDDFGKWSWACRPQVTVWKQYDTIDPLGDRAGFPPVRQQLQEGWLKLKLNPVAVLKFSVREGTLHVRPQTNVTLQWLLKGGTRLRLSAGPAAQKPEVKPETIWERTAPFEEQCRVRVVVDTTYTLRLSDDDGNYSEKQITITVDKEQT